MRIRELTDNWGRQSYADGYRVVELSKVYEEDIIKSLRSYLIELKRFRYMKMDGNSVERLNRDEDAEKCEGIRFVEIVNQIKNDNDFTPVKYMAQITKLCKDKNLTEAMTIGLLARGLRSFPSFLREIDVEEQLEDILKRRKILYSISRNTDMDIVQHTDVMVSIGGKDYRIWLFQNSEKGICNTIKRLKEERGKLPKGIHILCPMNPMGGDQKYIKRNGWCFYTTSYVENMVDYMETLVVEEIPIHDDFIRNIDLSKEEIQSFIK